MDITEEDESGIRLAATEMASSAADKLSGIFGRPGSCDEEWQEIKDATRTEEDQRKASRKFTRRLQAPTVIVLDEVNRLAQPIKTGSGGGIFSGNRGFRVQAEDM